MNANDGKEEDRPRCVGGHVEGAPKDVGGGAEEKIRPGVASWVGWAEGGWGGRDETTAQIDGQRRHHHLCWQQVSFFLLLLFFILKQTSLPPR